jgi:cation transport ATPase
MVADGINDAPGIVQADVAARNRTAHRTIAIESADIVLRKKIDLSMWRKP